MLIGLATGALLCGVLVATVPRAVPALPLAAVITALVLAAVPLTNGEAERKGAAERNGKGQNPQQ